MNWRLIQWCHHWHHHSQSIPHYQWTKTELFHRSLLINPYPKTVFKDSTKKSRLGQCKIFTDNMGKNHHRFVFSFLGSTVSNSALIDHDSGNETCKARMAFRSLVGRTGHHSIRCPLPESKLFLLQYLCQSFFLYFFSPCYSKTWTCYRNRCRACSNPSKSLWINTGL